jgi:hypothetical protein
VELTVDSGDSGDTVVGSQGEDVLIGGAGNDKITGGPAKDTVFGGDDQDRAVWSPGDGNDRIEGQDGFDVVAVTGSDASENVSVIPNGLRVLIVRDLGGFLDLGSTERIDHQALRGADSLTVGDMTATELKRVAVDLASFPASTTPDGSTDTVTVTGSNRSDFISVAGSDHSAAVAGLQTTTSLDHADATDRLRIETLDGNDIVTSGGLVPGTVLLFVN